MSAATSPDLAERSTAIVSRSERMVVAQMAELKARCASRDLPANSDFSTARCCRATSARISGPFSRPKNNRKYGRCISKKSRK